MTILFPNSSPKILKKRHFWSNFWSNKFFLRNSAIRQILELYRRNWHQKWCKKDEILSDIKNCYCFILLSAFSQFFWPWSHNSYKWVLTRSSEHIGISQWTGKRVECKPSAASDHLLLHNYDSDFSDFTILGRGNNGFRFLLKESILISRDSLFLIRTLHLFHYYYLIKLSYLLSMRFI